MGSVVLSVVSFGGVGRSVLRRGVGAVNRRSLGSSFGGVGGSVLRWGGGSWVVCSARHSVRRQFGWVGRLVGRSFGGVGCSVARWGSGSVVWSVVRPVDGWSGRLVVGRLTVGLLVVGCLVVVCLVVVRLVVGRLVGLVARPLGGAVGPLSVVRSSFDRSSFGGKRLSKGCLD